MWSGEIRRVVVVGESGKLGCAGCWFAVREGDVVVAGWVPPPCEVCKSGSMWTPDYAGEAVVNAVMGVAQRLRGVQLQLFV